MTPKQAAFVREYGIDMNATQAAIRAGYSPRTARSIGKENLTKPVIAFAIADARKAAEERAIATADDVLRELDAVGFARLTDVVSWGPEHFTVLDSESLPANVKAAVKSVKVKRSRVMKGNGEDAEPWEIEEIAVTMHDKVRALELGGKHRGMFVDKVEVAGELELAVHDRVNTLRKLSLEELRALAGSKLRAMPADDDGDHAA